MTELQEWEFDHTPLPTLCCDTCNTTFTAVSPHTVRFKGMDGVKFVFCSMPCMNAFRTEAATLLHNPQLKGEGYGG